MPRTKRDTMKRALGQALYRIEQAEIATINVLNQFKDAHPDYAQLLESALISLDMANGAIASFCIHAWGYAPGPRHDRLNDDEDEEQE